MGVLTDVQLSVMRDVQAEHYHDTCNILIYEAGSDDYGLDKPDYPRGWTGLPCGLEHVKTSEQQGEGYVPAIDARLRLPLTLETELDSRSRIEITHRYETELTTPEVFEIVGKPKRGPSGLVLELKTVTDGSEVGA